ncbi:MAG: haloacid dehalogenase-like hydrolase [Selenomonas sp.]|nr:haloacid dehalogenase-like hydrolase [Selenomonas sp.]
MKRRSFLFILCAIILCVSQISQAVTREEVAGIKVVRAGDFRYWTADSPAKAALVKYVETVTNKKSPDFIPAADRIAVFDVDGTLMCETAPSYFDKLMYLERVLDDKSWQAPADMHAAAAERRSAMQEKRSSKLGEEEEEAYQLNAFAGMTLPEYQAYVRKFMQEPEQGLTNLTRGEAFYLPMVEVVSYLASNQFKVYIVSGCDRMALRVLVDGVLPIEPEHIIGSDAWVRASNQGETSGLEYVYDKDKDQLVRGKYFQEDIAMNKVSLIAREIGRQPVLAFGNSMGDASMLNYTVQNKQHKSAAFVLLCDDQQREFGNLKKAQSVKANAEKNGWIPVSMQKEFKTIYGDKVKVEKTR